jgi:hypothetical protein
LGTNGGLTLNEFNTINSTIAITSFTIEVTYDPTKITNDQAITGIFTSSLSFNYYAATDPGTLFTIVPEPAAGGLALCGLLSIGFARRLRS